VSRRTSLIISNSLPSPPPGTDPPVKLVTCTSFMGKHLTFSSSSCSLLDSLIETGQNTELPVCQMVEVDVKWKSSNSRVQGGHMRSELPESIDEENRIIPSILSSRIPRSSSFHVDILSYCRMQSWQMHNSSIRDEGHGEVRMVMRGDDSPDWYLFFRLFLSAFSFLQKQHNSPPHPHHHSSEGSSSSQSSSVRCTALTDE
jgi:hypothetical protein